MVVTPRHRAIKTANVDDSVVGERLKEPQLSTLATVAAQKDSTAASCGPESSDDVYQEPDSVALLGKAVDVIVFIGLDAAGELSQQNERGLAVEIDRFIQDYRQTGTGRQ